MKHILLFLSIAIYSFSYSQSHYCATNENLKDQLRSNPSLITHLQEVERQLQEQMHEGSRASVLTIPVIFHVIYNGDAYGTGENITDEQILSQLDALNRDFNNWNADTIGIPAPFKPLLGNMQVEFCLARFDESGNITSGIERINLPSASYDRTAFETNVKPSTVWNANQYFNIWTGRFTGDLNGVLGYAQFPGMNPSTDGVVLRYDCVGTEGTINAGNELGRVATHEVGHWMGLYHIWGDDGGEPNECAGSDSVGDTPNQRIEYYGRPVHPQVSCSAQNMFMNYMDYVDDSAKFMFSAGQVARARASLLSQRGQLLAASSNCNLDLDAEYIGMLSPSDTECSESILPILIFRNNGKVNITHLEVQYSIDGGTNKLAAWNGNLAPRKTALFSFAKELVPAGAHNIAIFLYNANYRGNDDYALNDNATKNFYTSSNAIVGASTPFMEGFESSVLPLNWSVQNPNFDRTWVVNTAVGGYSTSGQSVSIDNFDNSTNPTNRKDALVTASYNLNATNFPFFEFDVAYATRSSTRVDTLAVYASTDCGYTWNKLWVQGGAQLATQGETNIAFFPTNTQWKTVRIDITPYMYTDNIQFKFENKSGWGNILYIDNVNIRSYGVAIKPNDLSDEDIILYPNPANNFIQVQAMKEIVFPCQYSILNNLGQTLQSGILSNNLEKIDLKNVAVGSYVLQLKKDQAPLSTHSFIIAQ